MDIDKLKLDYLTNMFLEQEIYLLDIFLSQIPYSKDNAIEIPIKDIPKDIFLKTTHDWYGRIIEILTRFEKLKIISNYRGDIFVDVDEERLNEYRNLLFDEQDRRKKDPNEKLCCTFDDGIFYLDRGQNKFPLALNFKTNKKKNQTLDLMGILYRKWKENFEETKLVKCSIPKEIILGEMKKRGYENFSSKDLADTKTYLKSKFDLQPELSKHVLISFGENDSYIFEIVPFFS